MRIRQKNFSQISPHLLLPLLVVVLFLKSKVLYSSHAGGWTLVKRVIFSDGLQPTKGEEIQTTDYRIQLSNYSSNLHLLVTDGLKNLRSDMGFQQFRFYSGPYLGFFVCGGKLGFREISDQYSYKKQPSKIRHYVRKKTFSFPGGGNCPLRPPAMYGPATAARLHRAECFIL